MDDNTSRKLEQLFQSVFELRSPQEACSLERMSSDKWDSMAHVLLISALESEFDIQIDLAESLDISSYQDAHGLLAEKLTS